MAIDLNQPQCAVGATLGGVRRPMCISSFEKTGLKIVQEPRAELRRPPAIGRGLDQAPARSALESGFDSPGRQAGPLLKIANRETLVEPQRIQHEFEWQL